jgi:hypothetical protein
MYPQTLCYLPAYLQNGVQRSHWILEDHRNFGSPYLTHLFFIESQEILALEENSIGSDLSRRARDETHNGESAHSLTATTFPDNAQRLALMEVERYTAYCPYHTSLGVELSP